ncbi:MAG: hypothetical protein ACKO6L_04050, partial [Flavobacteriales bacterium]
HCQSEAKVFLPNLVIDNRGGAPGEGGEGGMGGALDDGNGTTTVWDVIFRQRRPSGNTGLKGSPGQDGGQPIIEFSALEEVKRSLTTLVFP